MDNITRQRIIDEATLQAKSSPRIVWLMLGCAALSIAAVFAIPAIAGSSTNIGVLFFAPLLGLVAHQINIQIAIREEISNWQQLQIAERGEA